MFIIMIIEEGEKMSKYEKVMPYGEQPVPLIEGETILWSAKPKKSAFVLNKILVMMPFALLWLLFDSVFIIGFIATGEAKEMLIFIIPFFAFHLMPVWIWLSNVFTASKKWKNTAYYLTDRRILIQTGFIGIDYQTLYYKDIKNVRLRVGIVDKLLRVGDIYLDSNSSGSTAVNAFLDIENPYEIYPRLQKIVLDIQTDIEFPNDLRPEENPGYNTKYNPKQ